MSPAEPAAKTSFGLRYAVACAVAREAGALAKRKFNGRPGLSMLNFKGHQDYLSATDAEVESLIRARLHEAFPEDGFLGEEGGGTVSDTVWVVDPVDGTANFVRGIPQFCISIAYVADDDIRIGVIYDPVADELFGALRGRGATLNGEPIQVSGLADMRSASIEAGWSTRHPLSDYLTIISNLMTAGAVARRGGSGALALAWVAAGRTDGYCELHMNAWDALAGAILIEEAGGLTNDFLADDGLAEGSAILGCTPALADELARLTGIPIRRRS
ncbi:inositol monophosphatase family protein [Microvirga pudoricolor]|uniref:inositol monophosphatase family protein n=1 Tax=Microvirga pudoricolor TaxID=2778729 RepID=UPI00194ED38D|nr:inositol monophosphatase family protein [Microvirga pudoricolor]MBM6595856.1 inositol monophosphatase [Microvirga pudoricolor]